MHVATASYLANPNVGLFFYATNSYCLVPPGITKKLRKVLEEVLDVPLYEMKAAGTDLLGVFFAGNEDILFVPGIMFPSELDALKKLKIPYEVIDTRLTALGNNLLVNGSMCMASPEYEEKVISQINGFMKVKQGKISDLNIVGSLAKGNEKGLLVSTDAQEFEVKFLKTAFNVPVTRGTVNFGSPYISSGVVCNNHGFIIGDTSGGPEIQNADEALGFLD